MSDRRPRRLIRALLTGLAAAALVACGSSDDAAPGFTPDASAEVTYSYTIPLGAGEALDEGTPLEILPGTLEVEVGEAIEIINLDDRGHNVGPWFVGAGETLRQSFSSAGEFRGNCTVHPSGELILIVT